MEKVAIRKNIFFGCAYLTWIMALLVFIFDRNEFSKEEQKKLIGSIIYAVLIAICSCIPFVGWAASVVLTVFYIITIVKYFSGHLDYNMPIVYSIAGWFIKDEQQPAA